MKRANSIDFDSKSIIERDFKNPPEYNQMNNMDFPEFSLFDDMQAVQQINSMNEDMIFAGENEFDQQSINLVDV